MIATVSWLLGLAGTEVGYTVTTLIDSTPPRLQHPARMMVVSMLGLVISGVSGYVSLLYGGYANRNWAKADEIADRRHWKELLPDLSAKERAPYWNSTSFAELAWRFARDCNPREELAPVFVVFSFLAAVVFMVNMIFLVWSSFAWLFWTSWH